MKKWLPASTVLLLCGFLMGGGPRTFQPTKAEQELLKLTNAERKKKDLPALKASQKLFEVARAHSANMAKQGKMEHELDGKNPFDRIKASGYKYFWAGENIAYGDDDIPMTTIMEGWMDSKPHRENILNDKYTEIGLGMVRDKDGRTFYTQVFGKPQ